jgi:hypothetical protein
VGGLLDGQSHVLGRDELALLDVEGKAGSRAGCNQIGLAAEEGRDLQAVDHLGDQLGLSGLVDIGRDRELGLALHALEDPKAFVQACPSLGAMAGAVRLVEGGLEDHGEPVGVRDLAQLTGHLEGRVLGLDHIETRDEHERRAIPEGNISDAHATLPRPAP